MTFKDLRTFVDFLKEQGELLKIEDVLDSKFDVSAAIRHGAKMTGKAIYIDRVKGYDCPVVGNLLGSKKRMAIALGATEEELGNKMFLNEKDLIAPETVDTGAVKDVIINQDINLFEIMPVLTYHENDASPYITQGIVFMKDRQTGFETMGVHRLQVKGKDRLGALFDRGTSAEILRNAEGRGEPLEVAVVIGVDPATLLASILIAPFGDKFGMAGALRGVPMDMVQAEKVDLKIPAQAMFALEGKIIPGLREAEGPFGESTGYYFTGENPVIQIETVTHQRFPIYPVFVPWDKEDETILNLTNNPHILKKLRGAFPSIVDMKMIFSGGMAFISINKRYEGEPREILYSVLSTNHMLKIAMIVDDDVDLESQKELAWAAGTRCFPEKDVILLESVSGMAIDPTARGKDFAVSKLGIDATRPLSNKEDFRKVAPPPDVQEKIMLLFEKYLK